MLRSSLSLACVAALCATSSAQQTAPRYKAQPVPSTVRDAGVYHVATGAWTRKASAVNIGADIIYNNTCSTGYYSPLSGDAFNDEGRIPSPSSPNNLGSKPGCATSYTIDGFQIAYCTDQAAGPGTITYNFHETFAGCTSAIGLTPTAGFQVAGLPGAGTGTGLCWIVTLDLDSPPQTASLAFAMLADGDGTYSTGTGDTFGWTQESNLPDANQLATGPLIQGNFNVCTGFDGTRWDTVINYLEAGTGMTNSNSFYIENGPTAAGCYWFGAGFPGQASFHLELYSDACGAVPTGTPFCDSVGGAACPCAGAPQVGVANRGCMNSFSTNAGLTATGTASISADTVVLSVDQIPAASVLFFQGTVQQAGGAGVAFGDGKRCAGGTVIRLHTHTGQGTPGSATSSYPSTGPDHSGPPDLSVSVKGAIGAPGSRTYQAWYRNSAAFCTAAVFNLSNGLDIPWGA
jgi:hypothetical protein